MIGWIFYLLLGCEDILPFVWVVALLVISFVFFYFFFRGGEILPFLRLAVKTRIYVCKRLFLFPFSNVIFRVENLFSRYASKH